MARILTLETFDMPDSSAPFVARAAVEEVRLAAYEQGYAAGWDDAIAAEKEEIARIRADLGRNLTGMSLSYREARRHILSALEPLLQELVTKILPQAARASLGQVILDELRPAAADLASAPVLVRTAPQNRDAIASLLGQSADLPLRVVAEPTLGDGQAFLQIGGSEVSIDLDGLVAEIGAAVTTFFAVETSEDKP